MRGRNVAACIISVVNEKNGTKGGEKGEEKRKIKEKDCGREGTKEKNERNIIKMAPFLRLFEDRSICEQLPVTVMP